MNSQSFIIPFRVDTEDRVENCATVLRFLEGNFPEAEVVLVEEDEETRIAPLLSAHPRVVHVLDTTPGAFSRSRGINLGLLRASRAHVVVYDTDVLINPEAIRQASDLIDRGVARIVIPFNSIFVDLGGNERARVIASLDFSRYDRVKSLDRIESTDEAKYRVLHSGVTVAERNVLLLEGGYNQKMISYGWEDVEFFRRFEKLGYYSVMLRDFSLIHLDHRRGPDSRINKHYEVNRREFERVSAMPARDLKAYVASELKIVDEDRTEERERVRKRQALGNIVRAQPIPFYMNRALTYLQVHGLRRSIGRLAGRSS